MKALAHLILLNFVSAFGQQRECVDYKRTLRCVVPANCPPKQLINNSRCPHGRVCCKKDRPNLYLPLRTKTEQYDMTLKHRSLTNDTVNSTTEHQDRDYFDEERIIFPDEFGTKTQDKMFFLKGKDPISNLYSEPLVEKSKEPKKPLVRKSAKYCREYAKLTIDVGYASPLLSKLIPLRYEMENCEPGISPLVVGGSNATIAEFPHMVALGYNRSRDLDYLCGGSLISDQYVLTAAHCINTIWGPPAVAYMGSTLLYSEKARVVLVKKTIVHPDYRPPACYNDIALVKLARKVKLSPKLRPACLATEETTAQYPNNVAVATGWGRTGFARESSINLLKVALKVMDSKKCSEYYESEFATPNLDKGITSDLICAVGNTHSFEDTCQGDSGGPLQSYLPDNKCMIQVVGVTSFGKSCGAGVPGVYTRVATHLTWIEGIVWP